MSICTAPGRVSTSSAQTFRHPNASPSSALDRLPDLTVTQWWRLFHSDDPGQSLFTHNLGFDRCQLDFQPTVGEHDVDGASRLQAERHAELLGYDEASCRVDGSSLARDYHRVAPQTPVPRPAVSPLSRCLRRPWRSPFAAQLAVAGGCRVECCWSQVVDRAQHSLLRD